MPDEPIPDSEPEPTVPGAEPPPSSSQAAPAPPPEDWESRFKYLLADFENFRRRTDRERESVSRQARGAMLRELLPILEGFRSASLAISHLPAGHPVRQGFDLLDREWSKFLKHEGVEPVVLVGQPFRAEEAEAVGEAVPTEGTPAGSVTEVVQQGYRYFGGLLRPAKVIVARAPAPPTESAVGSTAAKEGSP